MAVALENSFDQPRYMWDREKRASYCSLEDADPPDFDSGFVSGFDSVFDSVFVSDFCAVPEGEEDDFL